MKKEAEIRAMLPLPCELGPQEAERPKEGSSLEPLESAAHLVPGSASVMLSSDFQPQKTVKE